LSQGNPRLIDNIMTDAITLGSQMEKKTIDSEVILAAANNQHLTG
jgi:type II secretory pathway predicted ATPase ExeA